MVKTIFDNSLNIVLKLEVDSVTYKGIEFTIGDLVSDLFDSEPYVVIGFEISVSKETGKLATEGCISICGEEESNSINFCKKIVK